MFVELCESPLHDTRSESCHSNPVSFLLRLRLLSPSFADTVRKKGQNPLTLPTLHLSTCCFCRLLRPRIFSRPSSAPASSTMYHVFSISPFLPLSPPPTPPSASSSVTSRDTRLHPSQC
eukprot:RCo008102